MQASVASLGDDLDLLRSTDSAGIRTGPSVDSVPVFGAHASKTFFAIVMADIARGHPA
jgi:hypothetical protein